MKGIEMLTLVLVFSGGFALGAAAMYALISAALILIAFKSDGAKKRIAQEFVKKMANR
jgi:hypothetical protein